MNESPDDRTQGEQFGDGRDEVPSLRIGRFRLYEPATTITDVMLVVLAILLAGLIGMVPWTDIVPARQDPQGILHWIADLPLRQRLVPVRITLISAALCAVGVAATLGAWIHGAGPRLHHSVSDRLWVAIGVTMTISATMLYSLAATMSLSLQIPSLRTAGVLAFAFVTGLSWIGLGVALRNGQSFLWGQLSLGVSALAVAIMAWLRANSIVVGSPLYEVAFAQAWWIGCAIYAVATVLHRLKIGLHRHFDHNALYHVLQMAAIIALGYFAVGAELGILNQYLVDLIE